MACCGHLLGSWRSGLGTLRGESQTYNTKLLALGLEIDVNVQEQGREDKRIQDSS